jgi:hypothetical protein
MNLRFYSVFKNETNEYYLIELIKSMLRHSLI